MKNPDLGWAVAAFTALFGGGGIWALAVERMRLKAKQPADLQAALATFSAGLNGDAREIIKMLREERVTLLARIDQQDARIEQLELENLHCRGENASIVQRVESLSAYLRRHGIDIPEGGVVGAFVTLDGAASTVMAPIPKP